MGLTLRGEAHSTHQICIYDKDKSTSSFSIEDAVSPPQPIIQCNCIVTSTTISSQRFLDELALKGTKRILLFIVENQSECVRMGQNAQLIHLPTNKKEWGTINGIEIIPQINCLVVDFLPIDYQSI